MKKLFIICVVLTTFAAPGPLYSQEATRPTEGDREEPHHAAATWLWSSALAYFNPTDAVGTFGVDFHKPDGSTVSLPQMVVEAKSPGVLYIGSTFTEPFQGSAVVSSDIALTAIYLQEGPTKKKTSPVLSNSLAENMVGAGSYHLPDVRRSSSSSTWIGIQNLETEDVAVTLDFISASAGAKVTYPWPAPVRSLSSAILDIATVPGLGSKFDGSAVVTARKSGAAAARVVAAVQQIGGSGRIAYASEGLAGESTGLLMPTAMCQVSAMKSAFDIQNAGAVPVRFNVDYYYTVKSGRGKGIKRLPKAYTAPLDPGRRKTVETCSVRTLKGKLDAIAVITATDAAGAPMPIAAVGRLVKTVKTTTSVLNSYAGQSAPVPSEDGKYRVILPYVVWSKKAPGYRTSIDVMNAAPTAGKNVAAIPVTATYYAASGARQKALSLYTRVSTDPRSAGALPASGNFSGAVVLESDRPITAVARVEKIGSPAADGYGGIEAP